MRFCRDRQDVRPDRCWEGAVAGAGLTPVRFSVAVTSKLQSGEREPKQVWIKRVSTVQNQCLRLETCLHDINNHVITELRERDRNREFAEAFLLKERLLLAKWWNDNIQWFYFCLYRVYINIYIYI